jgi:hypothetical protein
MGRRWLTQSRTLNGVCAIFLLDYPDVRGKWAFARYCVLLLSFVIYLLFIMQFYVPVSEFVDVYNGNDIDYDYRCFDTMDDAIVFAKSDDALPNAENMIMSW